ncbi:MAG: cytochrome c oxidase accessory protein CcoG [Bacteroidota bacterium]
MQQSQKDDKKTASFRDQLATIDEKGKRVWVYAKKSAGKFTSARNLVGILLLIIFFAIPFISIQGEPFLLLNFIDRKIIVFGVQFWPQDFHLFFLAMLSLMVFIILFTVTYGRIWCGWGCPQTVFMEIIFRRIEYWIEGDHNRQKKLDKQAWNAEKVIKRLSKHIIFFAISFIIINFFLMYIIGAEEWKTFITGDPREHIIGLIGLIAFAGVFYFIFSWFREQVCTIVCPYGRLQGVLLDRQSIVISYDYVRGEPKGAFSKSEDRSKTDKGDCVNCNQCVQVCPTGIDIRNGTQLECINCANCIDACNAMMKKVGLKTGLIRYASETMIATGTKFKFTIRTIAYSFVLLVLLGVVTYSMLSRSEIEATVLRAYGSLYQEQAENKISNLYNIKLVNKTNEELPVTISLLSHDGEVQIIGEEIVVQSQSLGESVFFIILDKTDVTTHKMELEVGIYSNGKLIEKAETTFVGPEKKK